MLAAGLFVAGAATAAGPNWSQLSPSERQILAPLQPEWEKLDAQRKQKWRGIAERYPRMSPAEQQRVNEQMRPWASLSPQERAAAREQYKTLKQLPPEKKEDVRQKWEQYRNLPPEERQKLGVKPGGQARRAGAQGRAGGCGTRPAAAADPHPEPGGRPAALRCRARHTRTRGARRGPLSGG